MQTYFDIIYYWVGVFSQKSESGILKKFCYSISPTAKRKQNLSKQIMAVMVLNALKLQQYELKVYNFLRFLVYFKYMLCKFIAIHKMVLWICVFGHQNRQNCPKTINIANVH